MKDNKNFFNFQTPKKKQRKVSKMNEQIKWMFIQNKMKKIAFFEVFCGSFSKKKSGKRLLKSLS